LQMFKIVVLSAVVILVFGAEPEMQTQCMCKDFDPCYEKAADTVLKCTDKCKHLLVDLGADYTEARKCVSVHQPKIQKAAECARKSLGEMCTNKQDQMVKKYYPENLQLAAVTELMAMAKKSGLLGKSIPMLDQSRKAAHCMIKCTATTDCSRKLKCAVEMPPDNVAVAKVKKCAISSGFTTPVAREICTCLEKSGIKQLETICPSLEITE
ncbi:hypothetical protein PMAYCL1PPCAC_09351, partial [Pristionchus mayeri]